MAISKLTLHREFFLGAGMTLFLSLAPQDGNAFTLFLFIGMFTIYETFPDFHWVPAWTLYKIVTKEEDAAQGACRVAAQFLSSTIAAIVGYKLLAFDDKVTFPTFGHEDDWRALVWVAGVWGAWLGLTQHGGKKEAGSFRRNFALTATFCSANYLLQGVASDCILNSAVNFARFIGAKVFADGRDDLEAPDLGRLWIVVCGPLLGLVIAKVALMLDDTVAGWDAPDCDKEETTAVYGSTELANDAGGDDKKGDDNA